MVTKGIFFSIVAGLMIAMQNIFNARASAKMNLWSTNALVQGLGLLTAILLMFLAERKVHFTGITQVNKLYLLGGVLGALIIFSVIQGVTMIGASYAITIVLVAQIVFAFLISVLGLFGEPIIAVSWPKILGLGFMIGGVVLFQFSK